MDGIAERGVRFTLQVATDQAAKAELNAIARAVDAVQQKASAATASASAVLASIPKASASGTDPSVMSAKEVNDRIQAVLAQRAALHEANNAKLAQLDAQRLAAADKFATEFQAIGMRLFNDEIDATTAASMVESFSQAATEAKTQYDSFQESLTSKAAKEAEKRTDKELQALKKRQQFHITEAKKTIDAELKLIEDKAKKESDAARAAELAAKRQTEAQMANYTRLGEKAKNSSRQLLIQFGEINESVMRFARGLVMVGLAGEEDMGKLTKSLVKMQGYFDFFSGAVKTLTKMNEMYRHMTTAIQAATAAQTALNLAQGLDPGGRVIRDPLNKDKTKQGAGGTAIGAAGNIGKEVASGGLDLLLLNALTGGKGTAAATSFGGKIATAIASKAGPIGIVIGSALATYQGIKAMVTGDFRPYEGAANPFMWGKRKDLRNAEEWTKKMGGKANLEDLSKAIVETPRQKADRAANKEIDELTAKKIKAEQELKKSANERMRATLEEQKPLEARKTIATELAKQYKAIHKNEAGAHAEVIEWQRKRLSNEKQISQEKAQAARASAATAKDELDAVIKRQEALRQGVMSAAERFATLDPLKQRELLATQKRIAGGDRTLTVEQLQSARGFGEKTDERISKELQRRAAAQGFGVFAKESFAEIAALDQTRKKLEVEVKQKLDFAIKIEADYDDLAKRIAVEIDKQQRAENIALLKKVNSEIAKLKSQIQKRTFGVTPP